MARRSVVLCADARQLPLPDNSVHAAVCDPPYNLAFMGRSWDTVGGPQAYQAWCQAWAAEALRVLKPGGWLLCFGGTRTWHRLTCGVEDAGFELRDQEAVFGPLAWLYGSGFPKSLNVAKAIQADGRALVEQHGFDGYAARAWRGSDNFDPDAGKGTGTSLKPAWEPILVARKPLAGTVAQNTLEWGTGGINVDACRIGIVPTDLAEMTGRSGARTAGGVFPSKGDGQSWEPTATGRWPANVVLVHSESCQQVGTRKVRSDGHSPQQRTPNAVYGGGKGTNLQGQPEHYMGDPGGTETVAAWDCAEGCPVALLDQQSGERPSTGAPGRPARPTTYSNSEGYGGGIGRVQGPLYADQGGASRFFPSFQGEPQSRLYYTAKAPREERVSVDGVSHPTVKPLELVRWLVRLVTPPSGTVLDLFCGSGTTGEAAMLEGFNSILVDNDLASCRSAIVRTDPHVRRRGRVVMREGKPREEGEDAQPRLF